jgi:uncharacterized protein YjiS (DUF1127 family)
MAFLLLQQDIEKLSGTLQTFRSQIIIKKMRNPFEMSAFHVERSGWMEMHRRRRNLEELSDRSNRRPSQLPRLAEFEHRYLQEAVGRSSVGHSDQNDIF